MSLLEEETDTVEVPTLVSRKSRRRTGCFLLSSSLLLTALLGGLSLLELKTRENLRECRVRLDHLAHALALYAADNHGRYPPDPQLLVSERFLSKLPHCPVGDEAYEYRHARLKGRDHFRINCRSDHSGLWDPAPRGYPQYDAVKGLFEAP